MSDYTELVERLRGVRYSAIDGDVVALVLSDPVLTEAANAIERLSVEVATLRRAGELLVALDAIYKPEGVGKWLAHHTNQLHAINDGNYL